VTGPQAARSSSKKSLTNYHHHHQFIYQKHDNKIHDKNTNGGSPEKYKVYQAGALVIFSTKHINRQHTQLKVKCLSLDAD